LNKANEIKAINMNQMKIDNEIQRLQNIV